ncbi:MAG TPA: secondary thiamine-phosphate synthase enzyme YjbQ [Rhodopila sp.]|uniref:secondary thiamine-phosphate synthase enzyme YjbQ n=1 Tax=Rhodopila sp. TaxID=2480087 RepID=UPI002CCC1B1B|nr:secondary thiamine-phosphate synthase enzyme YjbQ [Rhodopila sp.]HVY16777.1 secondary thiamine-phosphate synthase enzyme YjbQ [Rhodopila sp.]
MRQATRYLDVPTQGQGFHDVTGPIRSWVASQKIADGLLTIWCQHTSASLTVQENADPDVRADLLDALDRLAPEGGGYRHTIEGADDMPAHIRSMLTQVSLSIPIIGGGLTLGTWQAIYLIEHRRATQTRRLALHLLGA